MVGGRTGAEELVCEVEEKVEGDRLKRGPTLKWNLDLKKESEVTAPKSSQT